MIIIVHKMFRKLISNIFILKSTAVRHPVYILPPTKSDRSSKFTGKTFAIYCARKLHATSAAKYSPVVSVVADIQS